MIDFLTNMLWWHWAIIGFVFILAELALPAFVIFWFGLGAFLVMFALLLFPGLGATTQILLWTISSILMIVLWFKVFKQSRHKSLAGSSSAHLEGEIGMMTTPVAPFKKGKVRFQKPLMGSDLWECVADEPIDTGARVKVVQVEGTLMTVAKVS